MDKQRRALAIALALVMVAGVFAALAVAKTRTQAGFGPGMMGPDSARALGPGMGGAFGLSRGGGAGSSGTERPTAAQLTGVRDRINGWLTTRGFEGFKVAEVMAFTHNDYVAVHDAQNMPAFELLTDLKTDWVMEEPTSMMWNTRYGMMGDIGSHVGPMMGGWITSSGGWNGWYGIGSGPVATTAKAVAVANKWLDKASPGERVAGDAGGTAMGKLPGYYTFDTTRNGKTAGMLSVNATSGAVWYHAWHGTFLAEQGF